MLPVDLNLRLNMNRFQPNIYICVDMAVQQRALFGDVFALAPSYHISIELEWYYQLDN